MVSPTDDKAFASTRRDKLMGLIVLLSLLGLFYLAFFNLGLRSSSGSDASYSAVLSQAYGISAGGAISISGVTVGTVRGVVLEPDGRVRLRLYLNPDYSQFYRQGSTLKIDSQLGIGSVIGGSGLALLPGPEGAARLVAGSEIPITEPESLQQLVEDWNLRQMAETLQSILEDIGEIVASVNENQAQLIAALDHTAAVSANLVDATEGVPKLVADIDAVMVRLESTLATVDGQAGAMSQDLRALMSQATELTTSMTTLTASFEPTAERSPVLMDNLIQVSRETEELLNRLNHHWLLGSDGQVTQPSPRIDLPGDDDLYKGLDNAP